MAIKFSSKTQKIFLGDREVFFVFKGNKKVYEMFRETKPLEHYVQVSSTDFDLGGYYTGTEKYIILPEDKTSGYRITNPNVKGVATSGDYLTDTSRMFDGNNSLYLELVYLDTSNVTNMWQMFRNSQATSLDLSSFDTSNVTSMQNMFQNSKATTLDVSSFDTSNVTDMRYMFHNSQATTLDLSSFDTSKAPLMSGMFEGSQATTGWAGTWAEAYKFNNSSYKPSTLIFTVYIPDYYVQVPSVEFDSYGDYIGIEEYIILPEDKNKHYQITNSNVKGVATNGNYLLEADNMFNGYNGLDLELDYLDTSNVTTMYQMFNNSKLTTLDVSSFDTSNVTDMYRMFYNSKATSLDLSSFDTSNVTNMYQMFASSSATTLDVSSFDTNNVTNMGGMFRSSPTTTLDLSSFDTLTAYAANNVSYMFENSLATTGYAKTQSDANRLNASRNKPAGLTFWVKGEEPEIPVIPERYVQTTIANFTKDTSGWDYTGTEEYIILPENIPTGYRIQNANVKGVATSGDYLTDASNMFRGHTGLYLELDYLDTSNVTTMQGMFQNTQATTLDLSNFDTSNVTVMNSMFQNSKATTLDLSSFDTSSLIALVIMFANSQATTLDLSNFDTSNVTNMTSIFSGSQATTIDVSNFDTSNVTNMVAMFANSKATTLDLSSFDTSNVTSIDAMFQGSQATTGYARTAADSSKFNSSSNKPSTLTFTHVVKTPIERYVQVSSTNFNASGNYTGTEEYIILPEDKTSGYRIINANVKGVATSGDYLTNAGSMFHGHTGLYLELDYLDTSNVTNMQNMFRNSQAATLDLSNFDTSNVTVMNGMFQGSQATAGYARTQTDAGKFNSSSNKPSRLTFVVK